MKRLKDEKTARRADTHAVRSGQEEGMTPVEFRARLDAISEQDGVPYGRAFLLFIAEEEHAHVVRKYQGYLALSGAFKCFLLETVELLNTEWRSNLKVKAPLCEFYGQFIVRLTHSFQSLCGAERLAIRGYPYDAYTLLRNIFDSVQLASAALQKVTDFHAIKGIEPEKPFEPSAALKLRKNTERAVRQWMSGDKSGLSQSTIHELARWDALFDHEVHGARLSLAEARGWLKGTELLPVLPAFKEQPFAMFMNRFCEIGWMTHRLVPLIQAPDAALPGSWRQKWRVLDECFEVSVDALTKLMGKKIGGAIVEFVKAKFPFNENSVFPL